jgi:GABA(A) receptor-associated protein
MSICNKVISEKTLEERKVLSAQLRKKYNNRTPIIINYKNIHDINTISHKFNNQQPHIRKKFLVPVNITVSQLIVIIRKKIKLKQQEAIFIFVGGIIPPSSENIGVIYNNYANEDGFLYMEVSLENTFGTLSLS